MQSKKLMITVLFNALCITPAVLAMCTRTSAVRNSLSRAASARFSTVRTPVAQASTATVRPAQKRMLTRQFSDSSGGGKHSYQESWQQAEAKDRIKKVLSLTSVAAVASIIAEANEIADWASSKGFFKQGFDERLIPKEFDDAIIRMSTESSILVVAVVSACSGSIIVSKNDPNLYFVLTAAHCIGPKNYAHIKNPQNPAQYIGIKLEPLVIDEGTDVAVLLIPSQAIRKFKNATGRALPAIPASQLSSAGPRTGEPILLQGYPENKDVYKGKEVYKEKLVVINPEEIIKSGSLGRILPIPYDQDRIATRLVPSEKHSPAPLGGASGAPLIALRGKTPEVLGVCHASEEFHSVWSWLGISTPKRMGPLYASGCGKLPLYLQEAEKRALEAKEAEKNKSWLRKFAEKYLMW